MNRFLTITLITLIPTIANAVESFEPIKLELSGKLNTQVGHRHQASPFRYNTINDQNSSKFNDTAIVNDTELTLKMKGSYNDIKYGGAIKLNADTSKTKTGSRDIADKTILFIENAYGKIEAGSYGGVTDSMKVSAVDIAAATGGIDGHAKYWLNPHTALKEPGATDHYEHFETVFVSDPYLPVGTEVTAKANKITYYTPKFNGFKGGITYTPDSELKGTVSKAIRLSKRSEAGLGYRNILEFALQYDTEINDINFQTGLLYQTGHAKSYIVDNMTQKRKRLNAWELGILFKYKDISLAGSYGDWKKTGVVKQPIANQKYGASFWDAGIAYEHNNFTTSLTYYQSKKGATVSYNREKEMYVDNLASRFNKLKMLSIGVDYKLTPGLMPYAEVSHFKHDRANALVINKGEVYLSGVKLIF